MAALPAPVAGTGSIAGTPDGKPFTVVATALVLGAPDVATTTVVFLISQPVACETLASPGWDQRIQDGTQILEMKMLGTTPGTFAVVRTVTPAPGEASVNFTLSSMTTAPPETSASGGTATLSALVANASAKGRFDLKFGAQTLSGSYDAIFCPGGHEP